LRSTEFRKSSPDQRYKSRVPRQVFSFEEEERRGKRRREEMRTESHSDRRKHRAGKKRGKEAEKWGSAGIENKTKRTER
jgi:hypothetical protein